jgi:Ser/Thr protein kinase RdoA (MazF antagonist)
MSADLVDHMAMLDVLDRFPVFPLRGLLRPVRLAGGFSGAWIWRVDTSTGPYCLRAWPAESDARQVLFVHRLMQRASAVGLDFVPAVLPTSSADTMTSHAGRLWEVQQWMPGKADYHEQPTAERLRAACIGLARLHAAWEQIDANQTGTCPGLARRMAAAKQWRELAATGWRPVAASDDLLRPAVETAMRLLPHLVERCARELAAASEPRPLQPCLCDAWHDHYLFEGDRLSGLIDYAAARFDHPAVDVARTLGSLVEDDESGWTTGLAAYRSVRPLTPRDAGLARLLDRTGAVLATARWLVRLYHDGDEPADRAVLARRVQRLVTRLEKMENG